MKTRFNFVSEHADGMGFAARLVAQGESVRMCAHDHDAKSIGDNIVPKVGDVEDLLQGADPANDIFIFDTSGHGIEADYVRQLGFAVLGGSILADRLERDRSFGYDVMRGVGVEVPETVSFTSFEDAKAFVKARPETRWVYKPSKQLGDLSPSHVSYDTEDLIEMLDNIAAEVDMVEPQFELQAFEKGVAFSTELWFQNGHFVEPLTNHTLERKELMNEDIGPSGGCVGNLTWFCQGCPVCQIAKRLVPWARKESYHGMLDLNAIVTAEGRVYGLEFTPRFGYDASPTLLFELLKGELGQFFADMSRGQGYDLDLRGDFAGAIRVTIPPWPTEKHSAEENVPLRGIDDKVMENHFYPFNVKRDDSGNLCTAGAWGIIGLFTNHSTSPVGVFRRPLEDCASLRLKNKQYRTDLAKRFAEDFEKLEEAGVGVNASEVA